MTRRTGMWVGAAVVGGLASGVLAKVLDEEYLGPLDFLGQLFSRLGVWVFILALIARQVSGWARAASIAALYFVAMTAGYYLYWRSIVGYATNQWMIWGLLSVTFIPLLAAGVAWARSLPPDQGTVGWRPWARAAAYALPIGLIAGTAFPLVLLRLSGYRFLSAESVVCAFIELALAAALLLLLPRGGAERIRTLAMLVPAAGLGWALMSGYLSWWHWLLKLMPGS